MLGKFEFKIKNEKLKINGNSEETTATAEEEKEEELIFVRTGGLRRRLNTFAALRLVGGDNGWA